MDVKIYDFDQFSNILKKYQGKRVAIVHQSFWSMRGGERMVKQFLRLRPDADVYALFGSRKITNSLKRQLNLTGKFRFSWLNYLPLINLYYRISFPLWYWTFRLWNFKKYDLVISFSSSFAKGIKTTNRTEHWSIIFTPTRYLWDLSSDYFKASPAWRRVFMYLLYPIIRIADVSSAQTPDKMFAVSKYVALRVKKYYGRTVDGVIYPPVEVPRNLVVGKYEARENFYLAISPYEENKNPELIFESAVKLGYALKVIGGGNLFKYYRRKYAGYENIEILADVGDAQKWELLTRAKALLMLGCEDYGTIAHEAIYAGCPEISSGLGGVNEIVIDGVNGIVMKGQGVEAVGKAIRGIEKNANAWDNLKNSNKTNFTYDIV